MAGLRGLKTMTLSETKGWLSTGFSVGATDLEELSFLWTENKNAKTKDFPTLSLRS